MSNTIKQAIESARNKTSEVMGGGAKNAQSEGAAVANDFLHTPYMRAALPFINGGISGMVATTVIQPVDMIKVRIQLAGEGAATGPKATPLSVTREILASGKALDLYTGLSAGLLRQAVYTTARLGLFDTFMGTLTARAKEKGQQIGFAERATAGLAAGGLAAMVGNPADLALIRMQSDGLKPADQRKNYKSVIDALSRIAKSEGIGALWAGATPTVVRAMALNFGQLAFFSEAKSQLKTKTDWSARTQTLTASAIAGFFASFFSLPFDFVKTRLQKQTKGPDGKLPYKGMMDCFAKVAKEEGLLRFYRGFSTYFESSASAAPGGPVVPPGVITALAFDTTQELLWAGNGYGRVTSFYSHNLQKYTSFRAHPPSDGAVQQILFNDKGVIVLGARSVHMAIRRGLSVWPHLTSEDMRDLRCMSFTSKATSEILVAGMQDTMLVIDTNRGEIVKRIPTSSYYIRMKKSRYICAATNDGQVHILDPVKFTVIHKWRAHSAFINDMDVQEEYVVTCGTSLKQPSGTYMLDPFVMVFDLKNLSTMPPIPFPPLAAYVRMHPRMLTTGIVASQGGQIHVVDLMDPNTSNVRQANVVGSILTGIEIAPSGEAIALADTECYMHLWGSPAKCHFVEMAQPTEWPDEESLQPRIDWKDSTPLNSIGVPYYRETLLSALPNNSISDVGAPPPKISQSDLIRMNKTPWGFAGPSRGQDTFRNQVEDTRSVVKGALAIRAPKFLSEKARDSAKSSLAEAIIEAQVDKAAHALGSTQLESVKAEVPALYQNVEIQFSKYGVDDFDFEFYNKTRYAGLENHIANSYANSLLQVLHFTPLVRNLALQHAATDCLSEKCLLCELGYLSDMLQKTEGSSCHASNLLKCLITHPPALRLGLLEEDSRQGSLTKMNQGLTRYLLQTMADDYKTKSPVPMAMEQALATSALTTIRCLNCRNETSRSGSSFVTDLTIPVTKARAHRAHKTTFSQVLKTSVEGETQTRGWCVRCNRYQSLHTRKIIQGIPSVLTLNVPMPENRDAELEQRVLWATPGWLPEEIGVIVVDGSFFCYQGDDLKFHLQRGAHNIQVYSLMGLSVNIESGSAQKPPHLAAMSPVGVDSGSAHKSHLVAMVNTAHSEPEPPGESQWHLFNDFSVKQISTAEALTFNTWWKMPSVLVYQLKTANNKVDTEWVKNIDTSVLHMDFKPDAKEHPYRILDPNTERPGPHTTVALDTEFVLAKQSEVEMKSDGIREVIRPNFHALGRVSIVRGEGEDEGLAFIDDWIQVKEPVIDYLHKHSGILPGDLDPRTSNHCLVSLKIAYKRLWVLLNLGCKFVGHGLKGDFRVINIQVPKAQIIDTIDLFYQKNYRRKLSLKFLAWYLLKEGIQVDTHDSIEDARIALKLYRKWLEFEDAGITKSMLAEVYRVGDSVGFKPPGSEPPPQIGRTTPPGQADGPSTPIRKGGAGVTSLSMFTPGGSSPLR